VKPDSDAHELSPMCTCLCVNLFGESQQVLQAGTARWESSWTFSKLWAYWPYHCIRHLGFKTHCEGWYRSHLRVCKSAFCFEQSSRWMLLPLCLLL